MSSTMYKLLAFVCLASAATQQQQQQQQTGYVAPPKASPAPTGYGAPINAPMSSSSMDRSSVGPALPLSTDFSQGYVLYGNNAPTSNEPTSPVSQFNRENQFTRGEGQFSRENQFNRENQFRETERTGTNYVDQNLSRGGPTSNYIEQQPIGGSSSRGQQVTSGQKNGSEEEAWAGLTEARRLRRARNKRLRASRH